MRPTRNIRIYVRNKSRYNPETGERNFLFVDINDFAGTTIGDVKEDVRRQCRGAIRIDELFLDNQSLADDRSVAHYNLEDECILETTSNPFWVTCLYIKASEIKQEMEGNPNDKQIQSWTQKSLPKKYTLIGLLLNAKNEYGKQPPHFATLDEFIIYLERLEKKGATMHPEYTQKDMRAFEREYRQEFLGRYNDPIAAFIDHHAVRLGHAMPDEIEQRPLVRPNMVAMHVEQRPNNVAGVPRGGGRKKQERYCDDCEEAPAEVYCGECQGGLAMCRRCSNLLHAGASRRRHNLQDIERAPTNTGKPYVPRAFLAPFSIVLAMYSALSSDSRLSLTEDEIKRRAQPLTDTDLQDKQAGKYVGGFDCMENNLMNKGLVKKEAARIPTYALSATGQVLGQRLYTFYTQFYRFMESCRLPKVQNSARTGVINNRKLCLIIDDNERDKQRLLRYAAEKNIDAQVRLLPAGDYIWILTPPMVDPHATYTGKDYGNELVLPFVVERKSWEDFENTTNSARFKRQINNMLGSGLANCFYLMEGSTMGLKNNPTQHHQQHLKGLLEKLMTENGFYVNYTSSWMKSAQWLLWFTGFLIEGCRTGAFDEGCISYQEYMSKVARQRGNTVVNAAFRNANRHTHTWKSQLFVDHIIRDSQRERAMITTVREDLGAGQRNSKHLLVIQDLEQYNKRRQSSLNKCCEAVYANPDQARDIVEEKIGPVVHNMLHYDIASFWQLYIQVTTGVYVVRTETAQDTEKIHRIFTSTPGIVTVPQLQDNSAAVPKTTNRRSTKANKSPRTATISSAAAQGHNLEDPHFDHGLPPRVRHISGPNVSNHNEEFDNLKRSEVHRQANIHSIFSERSSTCSPIHDSDENEEDSYSGHMIKRGKQLSSSDIKKQVSSEKPEIQPFSGQGYCLGTRSAGNDMPILLSDNILDRTQSTSENPRMDSSVGLGRCHQGLVGGMWNSRSKPYEGKMNNNSDDLGAEESKRDTSHVDQSLHHTDFVDSQNEEDIIGEILAKSAAEASKISNEDEMLKLAVEKSRQNSKRETDGVTRNDLTDDEQLQLVLEMSKKLNKPVLDDEKVRSASGKEHLDTYGNKSLENLSEEEQLKHVIEMSKVDTGNSQKRIESTTSKKFTVDVDKNDEEGEMFKFALEMSVREDKSLQRSLQNEIPLDMDERDQKDVILIPDTEEDQIKLALEISKKDTPKKNNSQRSTQQQVNSKKLKRKNDESETSDFRADEGDLPENLPEEEQIKLAMELSMSQMVEEDKKINAVSACKETFCLRSRVDSVEESRLGTSPCKKSKLVKDDDSFECGLNKTDDVGARKLDTCVQRNSRIFVCDENQNLKNALERSKIDQSPVKIMKLGKQYLDEDEMMNIAIERSKIEHSPLKKNKAIPLVECVIDDTDNVAVIEIDSQNSQEGDKYKENESIGDDLVSSGQESPLQKGFSDSSNLEENKTTCNDRTGSIKHSFSSYCIDPETNDFENEDNSMRSEFDNEDSSMRGIETLNNGRKKRSDAEACIKLGTYVDIDESAVSPKTDRSDNFVGDHNADKDDSIEDSDYIPPSPERSSLSGNVSFSQSFFYKSPETISHTNNTFHKSGRNLCEKELPESQSKCVMSDTNESCFPNGTNLDSNFSLKVKNETDEFHGSSEKFRKSVSKDSKFDIRSSLFYDSSDSGGSEYDIFDDGDVNDDDDDDNGDGGDNMIKNKSKCHCAKTKENPVMNDTDTVILNKTKEKIDYVFTENFEPEIELEKRQMDVKSVVNDISKLEQANGIHVVKSHVGICMSASKDSNVDFEKDKLIDHLNKTSGRTCDENDTEMFEADQHSGDNYLDYDDDNDIDYQPDSQDMNMESESSSGVDNCSDLEENSQERNDLDLLPLIRRPRKIKYKQLKEATECLFEQKRKEKKSEKFNSEILIKTENTSENSQMRNKPTADEIFARQVQEELDREAKQQEEERALIDDAYIARQLHEILNKEPPSSHLGGQLDNQQSIHSAYSSDGIANSERTKVADVTRVCQGGLKQEISSNLKAETNIDKKFAARDGNPEALVRELQRRELEKIDRWRKVLIEDEKLAKSMQEMQDYKTEEERVTGETQVTRNFSQQVEPSFKQMVAQHKASKEKALAQLQEYRVLQTRRFQETHGGSLNSILSRQGGGATSRNLDCDDVIMLDEPHNSAVSRIDGKPYTNTRPTLNSQEDRIHLIRDNPATESQPTLHNANNSFHDADIIRPSATQSSFGSHMSSVNQSQTFNEDHVTQCNHPQSLAIKYSNVTCGNCGEKGHNRTFPKCPKYHTAEESARREAKLEKQRQQKEEKKKQEVETIHMLAEHRRVLEEMTSQIQREMGTIQNRLQQRASELESQVSSRVRKIENANKKKR